MEDSSSRDERRSKPDPKARERRVIPRISESTIRVSVQQIRLFTVVWLTFASIYIVALLFTHVPMDSTERNRAIFFSVVIGVMMTVIGRLMMAAKSFLSSQSQGKLSILVERFRDTFFFALVVTMILGIAHMITWF